MGGIAAIAKQLGHQVSGSDAKVYPPMSTQLEALGIELFDGYAAENLAPETDLIIVGNALSRGNPEVEQVLRQGLHYVSGAQWLHDEVLRDRWVLAVAGTHGKTSTASMLTWILESAGYNPGFMIGGVPGNFSVSARVTDSNFFVIEADEYDTAFFDKRSKFLHYSPNTLIINNLEFDHADIFASLGDIQRQFAHLLRLLPDTGQVLVPATEPAIEEVLAQGCWSDVLRVGSGHGWQSHATAHDGTRFSITGPEVQQSVSWTQLGAHNINNATMAMLAARHVGVELAVSAAALQSFQSPQRRLQLLADTGGVKVYDDFAHHPTAIAVTLDALQAHHQGRVLAVLEPRSNTMKLGVHQQALAQSVSAADASFVLQPEGLNWDLASAMPASYVLSSVDELVTKVVTYIQPGDAVLVMSNGSFDGFHQRLIKRLGSKEEEQVDE